MPQLRIATGLRGFGRGGAVLLAGLLALPAAARDSLGVFDAWAAFRDPPQRAAPLRCYAIAEPESANAPGGYATVAFWPQARVRGQFHVRLPAGVAAPTSAFLVIDGRRFALVGRGVGRGAGLWAADARGDAAIVAALRGARAMAVEAGNWRAAWPLRGAASAIDSAALGCVPGA